MNLGFVFFPIPNEGEQDISVKFFMLFYFPIGPISWALLEGGKKEGSYRVVQELPFFKVVDKIGFKEILIMLGLVFGTHLIAFLGRIIFLIGPCVVYVLFRFMDEHLFKR